jgi:hypothetical protein
MTAMEILKSEGPVWRKGFFRMTNISQRPNSAGRDWPLYGDEYGRMKFVNPPTDRQK